MWRTTAVIIQNEKSACWQEFPLYLSPEMCQIKSVEQVNRIIISMFKQKQSLTKKSYKLLHNTEKVKIKQVIHQSEGWKFNHFFHLVEVSFPEVALAENMAAPPSEGRGEQTTGYKVLSPVS